MKKKIVLTGGKFNRIHEGHIWLLKKAKDLGYLVVVLAHDSRNSRHYAVPSKIRKRNVEMLGIADKVVVGHEEKFVNVLKRYKPDYIVLGYDQKLPDEETDEYAKKNKINVVKFRKHGNYSTRKLISVYL
jgi:D-beta-D-heptose 7-phosphate kinase/D-beta-D-heptose 1-phosphate adenosyltransferase